MKRNVFYVLMLSIFGILFAVPALSQTATVKGVCKDAQGNPVTDAQVTWHNNDTGRTFKLKTNKKGEYFSLGVDPGTYNISLTKDGKELDKVSSYKVGVDEVVLDFDLKKSQEEAVQQTAKAKGLTPEQIKQMQEQQAKLENYNKNIVAVNEKLKAATAAEQATPPNYDAAIASLNEAAQMVPNEDLVWFRLGGAYLDSAKIQTDPAERVKRYAEAYNDLQKAIDLKKGKAPEAGAPGAAGAAPANGQGAPANGQAAQGNAAQGGKATAQSVSDNQKLAAYYDNFGAAASKVGKNDEAANAYKQAIELDPAHAAHYYLNLGITLMNSGGDEAKRKESAEAFDKAIAADPTNASAYYFKGQSLFAAVTTDASGKMVAPDGTTEALNKYLELQPNGSYSQSAKDMLAALGTKVETTYGTKKKK